MKSLCGRLCCNPVLSASDILCVWSLILIGYIGVLSCLFNCLPLKIDIYLSVFFAVDTKSQCNIPLQLSSEKGAVTVA